MNKSDLLGELGAMTYIDRTKRMVEIGREARADPAVERVLSELEEGGVYERRLALQSCYGSRDGARVLRALADSSRLIRNLARSLVVVACNDEDALKALEIAYRLRKHAQLLGALRRKRRFAPIDAFLTRLRERGDDRFCDLLIYGSRECLEKNLSYALARPSVVFWMRLARRFTDVMADILQKRLSETPGQPDPPLLWLLRTALPEIVARAPSRALILFDLLLARGSAEGKALLGTLLRRCPQKTFQLLRRYDLLSQFSFRKEEILALDRESRLFLMENHRDRLANPSSWFSRLPEEERLPLLRAWLAGVSREPRWGAWLLGRIPEDLAAEREEAFLLWSLAMRDKDGVIPAYQLHILPDDLRQREARRHLTEVAALATRPMNRIAYCQFLPWAEAKEYLKLWVGHPEGEVRALALGNLLRRSGAEEASIAEALALVRARKNEQDPVRRAMLEALNSWPKEVWKREHLGDMEQIFQDAMDAADLSPASGQAVESLLLKLFPLDGDFGALWLEKIVVRRGHIGDCALGRHLSEEDIKKAAPALLRIAKAWAVREREPYLLPLAQSLGEHVNLVEGLVDVLEGVLKTSVVSGTVCGLLRLFYLYWPERFSTLAPALAVSWEKRSWDWILTYVVQHRGNRPIDDVLAGLCEDVLWKTRDERVATTFLGFLYVARRDRFQEILPKLLSHDQSFVKLELVHHHLGWVRQDLLTPYLGLTTLQGRFSTGKTRWVLPFSGCFYRWTPKQQEIYASVLDDLIADPKRDIHSIRWAIERRARQDFVPADSLLALTRDERAAVQEMAIRSLSWLDAGQGIPTLLECLDDSRARIAIYAFRKALFEMPAERAVEYLKKVSLQKVTVAKEVLRILGEMRTEEAYQHLLFLDGSIQHRDVRLAFLRALWDHLERPETWEILERFVKDPDWFLTIKLADIPTDRLSAESERRLCALLAEVLGRPEPEARVELLGRCAQLPLRDGARHIFRQCLSRMGSSFSDECAAAARAVFARASEPDVHAVVSRLKELSSEPEIFHLVLSQLELYLKHASPALRSIGEKMQKFLQKEPLYSVQAVSFAALLYDWAGLGEVLCQLAQEGRLDFDTMTAAQEAVRSLNPRAQRSLEALLTPQKQPELRRLALTALLCTAEYGWTEERKKRLEKFRRDPAPLVARLALIEGEREKGIGERGKGKRQGS